MNLENALRVLGVDPKYATRGEVKRAKRLLERDMTRGDNEEYQKMINDAYEVVSSSIKKEDERRDNPIFDTSPAFQIKNIEEQIKIANENFMEIFKNELNEALEKGPFNEKDYEAFTNKYQTLKEEANKKLIALNQLKETYENQDTILGLPDHSLKDSILDSVNPYKQEKNQTEKQLPAVVSEKTYEDFMIDKKDEPVLGLPDHSLKDNILDSVNPYKQKRNQTKKQLPAVVSEKNYQDFMFNEEDRGLKQILSDLKTGLGLKKNDHKKLRASNIKVASNFKQELSSGNYLYNVVHFIPSIIKVPIQLATKLKNSIFKDKEANDRIEKLKVRVNNLSDRDLDVIYHEYRSSKVTEQMAPTVLNDLLNQKVREYAMKNVETLNEEVKSSYLNIFSSLRQLESLDEMLENKNINTQMRKKLESRKNTLLEGKAEVIKDLREKQVRANEWLSSGLHGFEEDMKAAESKMSYVGKRFAKRYDDDEGLSQKEAQLEKEEKYAIRTGNDKMALKSFVESETLLSENTDIKNSIFGKRSTGKRYYSPLAKMLDYRPDPFVRDVYTSAAIVGASLATINGMVTAKEKQNILENQSQTANMHNEEVINKVNEAGENLQAQSDTFMKGIKEQSNQAVNDAAGTIERAALDKHNWNIGTNKYHTADKMGHNYYNEFYQNTENSFTEVMNKYQEGTLSQADALGAFKDIANKTQENLNQVYASCRPIMEKYAHAHSHLDLEGTLEAMKSLTENPTAIMDMNDAMINTANIGEELTGLTLEQVNTINSLPSDLGTTLLGAATAAALAINVSNTMSNNEKQGKYGNEVTQMVAEYASSKSQTEQQIAKTA